MVNKFWLCLFMQLAVMPCFANKRNYKSDSLRTALRKNISAKNKIADTIIINDLNKLANEYVSSYPDSTLYYGQLAIRSAQKINYRKGIADGLLVTATVFFGQAKYETAAKALDESITLYSGLKDPAGISDCYKIYGNFYNQTGKYEKSLTYLNKALAIKIRIKDLPGTARIYLSLGNVYDNLGHSSTALDFYFKALNINTKLHKQMAMSANYNNIGVILQNMEIYPEALRYFNKALKTWKQMHSSGGISTAYQNIGEVFIAQRKYDDAINYISQSIIIDQQQDDKDGISSCYNDLGQCYLYKNQNEKAISYLRRSLKMATDNQIDYNRATALSNIALYYNKTLDYKNAYAYALQAKSLSDHLGSTLLRTNAAVQLIQALGGLKLYKEAFFAQRDFEKMKSSFRKDESVQKFTSYNFEYNLADKQRQQALQQKASALLYQQTLRGQRLLNVIFALVISAMIVILWVYYRQKRKQLQINSKLSEKNHEVLEQKINLDEQAEKLNELNKLKDRLISILAHDLRSPLSTLRGLFSLLEDATITHQQLLDMIPDVLKKLEYTSDFLDTLLFWINSQMDNFNNEKSFLLREVIETEVSNYKEPAALKGISLIESVPEELIALCDPNSIRIVIRNLVTNAIKFSRKNDLIEVSAAEQDQFILVTVRDTGMGMSPAQRDQLFRSKVESKTGTQNESGTGMGMLFCKDLVEKCNGTIWVTSEEGSGTEFCFTVPVFELDKSELGLI